MNAKKKAARLWNEETQSYQIPLSKPGRVEYPDVSPSETVKATEGVNPTVMNVTLTQNRAGGTPGTFAWGPQTKPDYEATEEHRRSNYGTYEKKIETKKVELITVYEVPAETLLADAVNEEYMVDCSLTVI